MSEQQTIKFSTLQRLEFCNSKDLPKRVKIKDRGKYIYKEWVGIGWITIDPPFYPDEVIEVVDD